MGVLLDAAGQPLVQLVARAHRGRVELALQRDNRREAKSDKHVTLTRAAALDLMRQLQAAADETNRQAYAAAKAEAGAEDVSAAVEFLEAS